MSVTFSLHIAVNDTTRDRIRLQLASIASYALQTLADDMPFALGDARGSRDFPCNRVPFRSDTSTESRRSLHLEQIHSSTHAMFRA
jgi:hypothetical protein